MRSPTSDSSGTADNALDSITVAEAMRAGVVTCTSATPLSEVAAKLTELHLDSVVVIDEHLPAPGWGTVSALDVVAAASVRALGEQTAAGSAGTAVATIPPDASLRQAAQLMTARNTTYLLVTDRESMHPTGALSALDIAAALQVAERD
jgi:CBS domain-containing protein